MSPKNKTTYRLSLLTKLAGSSVFIIAFLVILTAWTAISIFSKTLLEQANQEAERATTGVQILLEERRTSTKAPVILLSKISHLTQYVLTNDKKAMTSAITPLWRESTLDFLEVVDAKGTSWFVSRSPTRPEIHWQLKKTSEGPYKERLPLLLKPAETHAFQPERVYLLKIQQERLSAQ